MTGKRWLATLIVVLTGCTPAPPAEQVHLTGTIALEYTGMTPSADGVAFELANGLEHSIYYRGTPEPRDWDLGCRTASGGAAGFFAGYPDPPPQEKDVEVASGAAVKFTLNIPSPEFKTVRGTCQLNLKLTDGTTIHSAEFAH
jgi:hypothetical protein